MTVEDIEWLADEAEESGADVVEVTTNGTATDEAQQRAADHDISVTEPREYQSGKEGERQQRPQDRGHQQQRQQPRQSGQQPPRRSRRAETDQQPSRQQPDTRSGQMTGEGSSSSSSGLSDMLFSNSRPVGGFLYGLLGFVLSFVFTTIYFFYRLDEITDGNIDGVFPDGSLPQAFAWPFYNANRVDITVEAGGRSVDNINYIANSDQLNGLVFSAIIALMLVLSGYSVASRATESLTGREAASAGTSIVSGYLPLLVAGTFLFSTDFQGASGGPEFGLSLVLWGVIYAFVFGGIGGYLAGAR
ncbi:hypothetical protein [Halovenus salina]|uniref:DUF7978 domain-containing protein n=1 Tax=Halovenus salina TaxID=1510225 RepID=A0ABD5W518_9EURY